jgi:anti-sigma B factor antagonist
MVFGASADSPPVRNRARTGGFDLRSSNHSSLRPRRRTNGAEDLAKFSVALRDGSADGIALLSVQGELDLSTAPQLRAQLFTAIREGASGLIVDLDECPFIDSTGLGVLCHAARRMRGTDGRSTVVAVSGQPQVERVFRLTRVDTLVPLFSSTDAARAAVQR